MGSDSSPRRVRRPGRSRRRAASPPRRRPGAKRAQKRRRHAFARPGLGDSPAPIAPGRAGGRPLPGLGARALEPGERDDAVVAGLRGGRRVCPRRARPPLDQHAEPPAPALRGGILGRPARRRGPERELSLDAALWRHRGGHDAGGDLIVLRPDHARLPGSTCTAAPVSGCRSASACSSLRKSVSVSRGCVRRSRSATSSGLDSTG